MNELEYKVKQLIGWIRGLFKSPNIYTPTELIYRQRVLRLLDYYKGNQLSYLSQEMNKQFADPTMLKMQMSISNIVRFITDSLAGTFKHGLLVESANVNDQPIWDDMLDHVQMDAFVKSLEQNLFLCKTCFVKVGYYTDDAKIGLSLITPEYVNVIQNEHNSNKIDAIVYPRFIKRLDANLMPIGEFNYWTNSDYRIVNENQITLPNKENPENVNPYGIIPVVTFREKVPTDSDFFQFPGEELVVSQDALNIKLTSLNQLIKYQSFAQPVLTNPAVDMKGNVTVAIDPSKPIVIVDSKESPGKFEYITPNAPISAVQDAIDKEYSRIFSFFGLNPSDFVRTGDAKSAEAMREGSARVEEYRANIRQVFIPQIIELLNTMRIVWNVHNPDKQLSADDVVVKIQQSRVSYQSIDDQIKDIDWRLNNNFMTNADALLLLEDDLTKDEAIALYERNKEINSKTNVTDTGINQTGI